MIRLILTLLMAYLAVNDLLSQSYLSTRDSVFLVVNEFQEKLITHRIEPKQTVYSLGKFYGLKVSEVYYYNPEIDGKDPKVGQIVKIPIPNKAIVRERDAKFRLRNNIPLYYRVQKGEGVKKIAEGSFNMSTDTLKKRNKIKGKDVKVGQVLQIGWISANGVSSGIREVKGPAIVTTISDLKTAHQEESIGKQIVNKSGVAFWQKDSKIKGDLYALHRECPENSIIAIHNPAKNKTIYAKVIGNIPAGAYDSTVEVIISPRAARLLGAVDARFYVKLKYFK